MNLKLYARSLLFIALCLLFVRCDKSDEYENYPEQIVGGWYNFKDLCNGEQIIYAQIPGQSGKTYIENYYFDSSGAVELTTYAAAGSETSDAEYTGTYEIEGNKLRVTMSGDYDFYQEYTINSFVGDYMTVTFYGVGGEYETIYKRL